MVLLTDDPAGALLAPVRDLVDRGLQRLGSSAAVRVSVGDPPGISGWADGGLVLSAGLLGPGLHHPAEGAVLPLDRWRRAAAAVLEAAARSQLAARFGAPAGDDWRWVGAAAFLADRAAPELTLADPDVALAVETGDPGAHPRAGVAVMRAWAASGADPVARALGGAELPAEEWLALGRWVLSSGRESLPVPVGRPAESDIPCVLAPWSWRPLRIPAHPRGGRVMVEGDGAVDAAWVPGGVEHTGLAAAGEGGCRLSASAGGPVGSWDVASAEGFGQILGVRGVRYVFHADGRAEIVLADAFVGPLRAAGMAPELGTSGVVPGRWKVAGPDQFAFYGLDTAALTLHSRSRERFAMPARGFGMAEWLGALADAPWTWSSADGHLVLRGSILGGGVEVRLTLA
jgi:hypothetical protein